MMIRGRTAAMLFVVLAAGLAGCAADIDPEQQQRAAACRARGLEPDTAEFAACLDPAKAAVLLQGAAGWEEMDTHVEQ